MPLGNPDYAYFGMPKYVLEATASLASGALRGDSFAKTCFSRLRGALGACS